MEGNIKILLVDDDPLVLKMYQDSLTRQGLKVETVNDGLVAVQTLRTARPQVVVLDLMMPRFSGVDVLKFIRSDKALVDLPVVVLSNSYMNDMANAAVNLGVQAALMKVRCTPRELAQTIRDVASRHTRRIAPADLETASKAEPPPAAKPSAPHVQPAAPAPPAAAVHPGPIRTPDPAPAPVAATTAEFMAKARADFIANGPSTIASLRGLSQTFNAASDPKERTQRIETFYRKVHFLSATAGLAECHQIAWLASGFEAMLFELIEKPNLAGPSVLRTIASTLDFLGALYARAANPPKDSASPPPAHALVVDDDPVSNRVIVAALRRAEVHARSTQDPKSVVPMLEQKKSDLILLDIEMPGMDGFEVCKRIRALPNYAKTPVIYVTGHDDFENRAKGVLSGGTDLISKPVFPIELAVKAVTQMLKSQATAAG